MPASLRGRVIMWKGDDMDELISKRAVIEAIEKARANVGHNLERSIGKTIIEILDDVGRDVDRLPSAHGTNLAEVSTDVPDINVGELISRQAAIDYFVTNVGFHDEDGYPIEDECELREIWTGYFDGIPSAEPQIIRCKECMHRDKYGCCKYWKGLAMVDIPIATDDNDFCNHAKRRNDVSNEK